MPGNKLIAKEFEGPSDDRVYIQVLRDGITIYQATIGSREPDDRQLRPLPSPSTGLAAHRQYCAKKITCVFYCFERRPHGTESFLSLMLISRSVRTQQRYGRDASYRARRDHVNTSCDARARTLYIFPFSIRTKTRQ